MCVHCLLYTSTPTWVWEIKLCTCRPKSPVDELKRYRETWTCIKATDRQMSNARVKSWHLASLVQLDFLNYIPIHFNKTVWRHFSLVNECNHIATDVIIKWRSTKRTLLQKSNFVQFQRAYLTTDVANRQTLNLNNLVHRGREREREREQIELCNALHAPRPKRRGRVAHTQLRALTLPLTLPT